MSGKTRITLSLLLAWSLCGVVTSAEPAARVAGQHDMLLLLPEGPVHVRLRITDGGQPLEQLRQEYTQQLIATLDTDGDGELSRKETGKHPLFVSGRRFEGNEFLQSLRPQRPYSVSDIDLAVDRAAGQLVTYRQVNLLAEQDLGVFRVLDADESGLIERVEMRLAPARIAERDTDFDQCVTFDEFLNEAPQGFAEPQLVSVDVEPPATLHSELLRDAREPILAARLVRRYDDDRDAHLTSAELGWTDARTGRLDSDGDRRLNMQELGRLADVSVPEISLDIDLSRPASEAMQLAGAAAAEVAMVRPDLVRLKQTGATLSIGYRYRAPLEEARQNAATAFNAIDVDANGYLDREEVAEHQRFERYLFDAMDGDEDDRVFAEEMLSYVEAYTEPASTTCQVTLLDTGNGFFQMLDQNADGRISIRELRECEQRLVEASSGEPAINPSRLTKAYRIEIVRGGVSLFGRVDRPSAETPAALIKPPSGPVWFQRMDRNGDGDLTWDEFLGPREIFHQIDADRDDLIDETEATQATEESK